MGTKISWTDETWNWITGCSKISAGCVNCYAAEAAKSARLQQFPQYQQVKGWNGEIAFVESQLNKPFKYRRPTKFFTASMSDVFHENVLDEWRDKAFAVIEQCPQHTFQILTKRPQRMLEYINSRYERPLSNVWLGVTCENQKAADERIPILMDTRSRIKFLSCEPLLGEIDLSHHLNWFDEDDRSIIDWVIVGGESGSSARPCHVGWIRSIVNQCQLLEVSCFVKQLGSHSLKSSPYIEGVAVSNYRLQLKDKKGGNPEEWDSDLAVRRFPNG